MKRFLEIFGKQTECSQQSEMIDQLRDEALQEKAKDEFSLQAEQRITETVRMLGRKDRRVESLKMSAPKNFSPTWAIGFACALALAFFLLPTTEESVPEDPPISLTGSLDQKDSFKHTLEWADSIFAFETELASLHSLSLPDSLFFKNLDRETLVSSTPIQPISFLYDKLSSPSLPEFEIPALKEPATMLYMKEAERLRSDLQNGFLFLRDSFPLVHIETEG